MQINRKVEAGFLDVLGHDGDFVFGEGAAVSAQASGAGFTVLVGHCIELGAAGLPLAPLIGAWKVTVAPPTGLPKASVTVGNASASPPRRCGK